MESKELINIMFPEHDRTSCSDENISNGFSHEYGQFDERTEKLSNKYLPRCRRCACLDILNGEVLLDDYNKLIISEYF